MSAQELTLALLQTQTRIQKRLEGQFSIHGINLTEFFILKALESAPEQTLRRVDLAQAVSLTASGVTRVLAPMEKIKLVAKQSNPRDARVSSIKLTEAGLQMFSNAQKSFEDVTNEFAGALTESQQERLLGYLRVLMN